MTIHMRSTLPFRAATVVLTLTAASLWLAYPHGAQAVAVDRGSRDYMLPDQMQWRDTNNGRIANLYGDPSKAGLYAYILKRGPNMWSMPQFQDNDRFMTVLEGTLWVGTGKFDPQRTSPLKAGSFVRDVSGGVHFEGAKDDGATVYVVGIGPSPDHPSKPGTPAASSGAARSLSAGSRARNCGNCALIASMVAMILAPGWRLISSSTAGRSL